MGQRRGEVLATGLEAAFRAPSAGGTYRVMNAVPDQPGSAGVVDVRVPGGLLEAFTVIVIPDTQIMVTSSARGTSVERMGTWIADQRDARNIAFVTQKYS